MAIHYYVYGLFSSDISQSSHELKKRNLQHHLHRHALPVVRRRHMRKNQNLPLRHFMHLSIPMHVFNLCTLPLCYFRTFII